MSQNDTGEVVDDQLVKKQERDPFEVVYKYRWFVYFGVFDLVLWMIAVYFNSIGESSRTQGISMYDSIAVVTGSFALIFALLGGIALVITFVVAVLRRYRVQKQEKERK